jgi:hypothetical protein
MTDDGNTPLPHASGGSTADYFRRSQDPHAPDMAMNFGPAIPVNRLQHNLPEAVLHQRRIAALQGALADEIARHGEESARAQGLRRNLERLQGL